jgi:hypothetical protein
MTDQKNKGIVLSTWVTAAALVLLSAAASAQTPAPSRTEAELVRARQKISMMEGVLERAVANGAENLLHQVRAVMPTIDAPRLIGAPEVRGFTIDGYGVFFDVEVPDLLMPPTWSLRYMVDQNGVAATTALGELKTMVANVRDADQRQRLMADISRLEAQVGPAAQAQVAVPSAAPAGVAGPATVAQTFQAAAPAPSDRAVLDDPNEGYTREVKSALMDAMLENSGLIPVAPNEWMMVALRSNARPDLSVTDNSDAHTILLRVKGSDLAAFRASQISQDEARSRVEVREY